MLQFYSYLPGIYYVTWKVFFFSDYTSDEAIFVSYALLAQNLPPFTQSENSLAASGGSDPAIIIIIILKKAKSFSKDAFCFLIALLACLAQYWHYLTPSNKGLIKPAPEVI